MATINQAPNKSKGFTGFLEALEGSPERPRNWVAIVIVLVSVFALVIAGVAVIIVDSKNAMSVFNIIVPVIAAWVGTVLAFYFGRENFESANKEVRETNQQVRDLV
jgi:uncharacterized membrane protein YdjX (TVP38/TMEM64 family)